MKKFEKLLEKRWAAYAFALCIAICFYFVLQLLPVFGKGVSYIISVIYPVIVGIVMAYLLNPVSDFFEKKLLGFIKIDSVKRGVAVLLGVAAFVGIVTIMLCLVIPSLIKSLSGIIENVPVYKQNVNWALEKVGEALDDLDVSQIEKIVNQSFSVISVFIQNNVRAIVNTSIGVGTWIFNTVVGFFIALYILVGKQSMFKGIERLRRSYLEDVTYKSHTDFILRCHNILIRYIYANLIDSAIVAGLNAIAMLIVKLPFVPLISLIVGITNLAPTFGPLVGLIIGGILLFLNNPVYFIMFAVITLIIQIIDGYVVKPRLFGGILGVPPVWILISIIVAGKLFGVIGILLAIPFAAIVTFLYDEGLIPWLERKKAERVEAREKEKQKEQA